MAEGGGVIGSSDVVNDSEMLTDPTKEMMGGSDGVDFLEVEGASLLWVPDRARDSLESSSVKSASGLESGDNGEGGLLILGARSSSDNSESLSRSLDPAGVGGADGVISNLSKPLISWLIIWSLLSSCVSSCDSSDTREGDDDADKDALEFLLDLML